MRRGLGGEPNPKEYKEKQAQLEEFKRLESQGVLDLYYLDETGFSLIPCVTYGWQNLGEYKDTFAFVAITYTVTSTKAQGEKEPRATPYFQSLIPFSSATAKIRLFSFSSVPSSYHRPCHRCAELFDAHCSPCGMSHRGQPVINTYTWVFNTLRNGTCGIPRPLFSGA